MVKCYYLIYKLKHSPTMWIINVMEHPYDFYEQLKNINSDSEKYYIIMKNVKDIYDELEFKRFTIFKKDKYCEIISETTLI